MVTDHQKTSKELKSLVDRGKVKATLPSALDSEHQQMLDDLKAKSGKDFDQSYDQMQVQGHEDAVALFTAYAKGGIRNSRSGRRKRCPIWSGTSQWRAQAEIGSRTASLKGSAGGVAENVRSPSALAAKVVIALVCLRSIAG